MDTLLDANALSRLKWRCRRGMLENDLFIERFFQRYASTLTQGQALGIESLMDLADNDLLDLLMGRQELQGDLDQAAVRDVLALMRQRP
ncbi:MAG: succinate dehydrogenase assembly factor 2 [Leptothrix ochracea]|uniref:FAD assembly factor SdhE n=1 Tax=Leptothrix ochracea TaxID=735331 RepID=UPI0034E220D8